jgi:hypothetical protein
MPFLLSEPFGPQCGRVDRLDVAAARRVVRAARITALILPFIGGTLADAAPRPSVAGHPYAVVVETSGNVAGFTPPELAAYLARRMHEETAGAWQFSAGGRGAAPGPDRIVWSFKTLRVVWKGGSHRGFSAQENSVSYLSAEVKLYLSGDYQMTMLTHPSVSGEADDAALSEMVRDVARVMFENKPESP